MSQSRGLALAEAIADHLADPNTVPIPPDAEGWWHQSLARGAPGIALLHIALAAAERRPCQRVHAWLAVATSRPVTTGADSHPMHGAPALAHAIGYAAVHRPDAYAGPLAQLNVAVEAAGRQRLDAAHRRLDGGGLPNLAEFDTIRGLTGFGTYLLHHHPTSAVLPDVVTYLVRPTEPVAGNGVLLPGWWTRTGPDARLAPAFPGGHGNLGVAHGIAGPLAMLGATARRGIRVNRQLDAIRRICAWLDQWRRDTPTGTRWPYWITHDQQTTSTANGGADLWLPSWCYGVPGIARAVQLAAIATDDPDRQQTAETAALAVFTDPHQQAAIEDTTLCHGYAGLAHLANRIAADSSPPHAARLRQHAAATLEHILPATTRPTETARAVVAGIGPGLLDGAAGIALAALGLADSSQPIGGWDTFLALT